MTPFRAILIVASLFLYGGSIRATPIEDLRALFQKQKYVAAYELGSSMSAQEGGNPDFDFLYGVAARRSGHAETAIFALERVVMNNPNDAVATYEKGVALLAVRDLLGAEYSFQKVLSLDASDELRENANRLLEIARAKLEDDKNSMYFSLQAAVDIGFNSNVNSGVNDIVEVPTAAPEVRDGYVNFGVAALAKRKLAKRDSFFFSLASSNRKYFRSIDWDFNIVTARMGLELDLGALLLRLPLEADLTLNHYDVVRIMPSLGFELMRAWDKKNMTTFSAKVRHKAYRESNNNYLSPKFALQHRALSLAEGLNLSGEVSFVPGFAYSDRPGAKVKCELGAKLEPTWEFAKSHLLMGSAQFLHMRFPVSSVAGATRFDENLVLRLGYEWHFAKNWAIGPLFSYYFNHSTNAERRYTRYQAQLGIRYEL